MNNILSEDIKYIHSKLDFSRLEGKKILITGATGLIGTAVILSMLEWNKKAKEPIRIIAVVRNADKANKIFGDYDSSEIEYLVSDVCDVEAADMGIDYIIHGAVSTSSKAFVGTPVEIIKTSVIGTINLLELAKKNNVKGFAFLSSMEVYGTPATEEKIYENRPLAQNVLDVRACYPESKCMCENLCVSYASEYGVPAKIVRLTQTFGPGVNYNDGRVFAEFARCVIESRDIVLKTKGETKRNYLYLADSVTAILTVLLDGETANAYNAANEDTFCSIYDMACTVAGLNPDIKVVIEAGSDISKLGYNPTMKMNLSTEKLRSLGWEPKYGLIDMYSRMIETMKQQ